jgi:hypothetical protein
LERLSGQIEFGATAKLVTQLEPEGTEESSEAIASWLQDERGLALSIWDPELIEERGNHVYRMQIMELQFVTIQLAPWVDVSMKTVTDAKGNPVFLLQSVDFDPSIQILPGLMITAKELGIVIEVAGQMRPVKDGTGVTGKIAFQTTGLLPGPLRLLPDSALQAASDAINNQIVDFAVESFRKGAVANFQEFRGRRLQRQQHQELRQ